jgi:phage-related protein
MAISRSPEHRLDSFIGDATEYTRTIDTTEDILALTGQITKFLRRRGSSKSKQWDLPIDKCYLKMSELSSPNLRQISIPSTTDVILV